jgi:hypothetical protein
VLPLPFLQLPEAVGAGTSLKGSATWGSCVSEEAQPVWVTLAVSETPPAVMMQGTLTVAEPCAVTELAEIEFAITLQLVSVRLELPENSTALEADLSSATMQALAEVLKVAMAFALVWIGEVVKICEK